MQGDSQRQAYDRGVTVFSPDGRLYQVEYAREAVKRGSASVGVRTTDGVAFAARRPVRSSLMEAESVEKLHRVDDHVGVASAGHAADTRRLVDLARQVAQREQLRYGEPATVPALTRELSDHVQEYTQTGGARPYGTALLLGGVDDGRPRLFETDPSGATSEWRATAVGNGREAAIEFLEDAYDDHLGLDDGTDLALRGLARTAEEELTHGRVGLATVGPDGYVEHDDDAVADRLDALEFGAS